MSNKDTLPPLPKECIYAFSSSLPAAVMSAYYSGDQMREYARAAIAAQAPTEARKIEECYGDCATGNPATCPNPCNFKGRPLAVGVPLPVQAEPPENLPTKEHIRELTKESVEQIMEQAQIFASTWSSVGGPFDDGSSLQDAYDAKDELLTMVRSLADLAAETVRPQQPAPAAQEPLTQLTEKQIEQLREKTFSTNNPFCPVDSKSMRKAVRAAEAAHGIGAAK